jgi:UDP-N-acetylglucosamine:LPS N-acetylglucosamine transferase
MDLAVLGKKALLIPTPGQTEQEYLARHLSEKGLFITQNQDELNLEAALAQLPESTGFEAGLFSVEDFRDFL